MAREIPRGQQPLEIAEPEAGVAVRLSLDFT
jgi:hypothetical protein